MKNKNETNVQFISRVMKNAYHVEYLCPYDGWTWMTPNRTFKLIGFARREAKEIKKFWPGTKTRIVKTTSGFAIVK